ncbi:RagB/SusD family nutrient uptake outer membrane protein [Gaoshiqia sp. Z1-71]|uniref:RagB/SusD family nutrient uptake outer membrane protein n=1 Tax=Gaoshiqia hydrogeniformans TaxID=3290090 RepID=UPI003BF92172
MKKKYILLSFLVLLFSLNACNDFLEFEPYGQPNQLGNLTDDQAMQSVYALFDWQYREGTMGRGFMWYENCSDNLITGRTQAEAQNIKNFVDNGSSSRDVRDNWPKMYETINYANQLIKAAPNAGKLSEKVRNNVLGHAYFWRGFAYLWLAPWYGDNGPNGGIPIVTENTTIEDIDVPRPASVLDNYDLIIEDLKKAGELLPYFDEIPANEWGLMHKTAAWSLIARAALYAAQYDNKYYDTVIEYTDKVINSEKHGLLPKYKDVFLIENNWSREYIMSVTSTEVDGSKFPGVIFQNGGFGYYNTWGYFQPTVELYNAFEAGDERLKATIVAPGDTIQFIGNQIIWAVNPSSVSSPSAMTFGKYLDPFEEADCVGKTVNPNSDNGTTDLNVPLVRYADVLLMKAEALIWKNGEGNATAKELLNDIRERAGLPRNSQATKAQLKNERRCEFALEFGVFRHLDLVRWGDAKTAYAQALHGFKVNLSGNSVASLDIIEVWPARNFDPAKHHVFPIPTREIAKGVNLKQNQGY